MTSQGFYYPMNWLYTWTHLIDTIPLCEDIKGWNSKFLLPQLWTQFSPLISAQILKVIPVLNSSGNSVLKNDQDIPDWLNIMGEMFKKLQTSKNLCAKRGFTGTEPLRITVGSHGMIQCPFYCHHIKAECLRSFLSFYRLKNTSKTPKFYAKFENLQSMIAAIFFFLGELTLK